MRLSTQLITPPVAEPVTLPQAKAQLRVDGPDEDTLITGYIIAARQHCEKITRRAFFNQTHMRTMDFFPCYGNSNATRTPAQRLAWPYSTFYWDELTIELPHPRTVSVTSITYIDNDGQPQTLDPSTYSVDITSVPARITPAPNAFWPIVSNYKPGSVQITYVAGSYGDGLEVNRCPQTIVLAMLLLISHWFENRSASSEQNLKSIPMGANELLAMERVQVVEYR